MGRRRFLTIDSLEGREYMSITPILGLLGPHVVSSETSGGSSSGGTGSTSSGSSSSSNTVYPTFPAITNDTSAPTPSELARRFFKGTFSGRVSKQPPRLGDQAAQYFILAPGNTNQFLHGTLEMRYYTPAPGTGATPGTAATFTTGTLSMSDRSTQSGGVILGDLLGDPTQVDSKGRPTQFLFSVNGSGGSGGIYASSYGGGTVSIKYQGNQAKVVVIASIFTSGVGDPLEIFQSNTHH